MERNQQNDLCAKLSGVLNTRDMRYMFVKLYFPTRIPYIQLEGTPNHTCFNIVEEVTKCGLYSQLKEGLEKLFPGEDFTYVKK